MVDDMMELLDGNVVNICPDCSEQLRQEWQEKNKDLVIIKDSWVKIKFTDESVHEKAAEWMWVNVTDVTGKEFMGTLQNHPVIVKNINFGDTVYFAKQEVQAYLDPEP
jgi:uncharacterized protein YegJ (DUF2314 family)